MALLDLFRTATGAFAHAAALARAEGIAPAELLPHALGIREILVDAGHGGDEFSRVLDYP